MVVAIGWLISSLVRNSPEIHSLWMVLPTWQTLVLPLMGFYGAPTPYRSYSADDLAVQSRRGTKLKSRIKYMLV